MGYRVQVVELHMVRERTITIAAERVSGPVDALAIAQGMIGASPTEIMLAIMIDARGNVRQVAEISRGGVSGASLTMADMFRPAIACAASAIVLAHNHPSGDPMPSAADIDLTRKAREAGALLGVSVVDHAIVTSDARRWSSAVQWPESWSGALS
jgi:DNA repair protein RadC